MNLLDWLLLAACVMFAISGYRQGFVVGVLSFAGFLGGGAVGMALAPHLVASLTPATTQAVVSIVIVFVAASLGQFLAILLAGRLRGLIIHGPLRVLDNGLGAVLSAISVLLVAWFVASALRAGPLPTVSDQIRGSAIITTVDQLMPDQARSLFSSFRRVLDDSGFPRAFSDLAPEQILPVDPPSADIVRTPQIAALRKSVVKVEGLASSCKRDIEGSGFVFERNLVLTNAHVVAGVDRPTVQIGGQGKRYDGRVVVFDPNRDLAVIRVPSLPAPVLRFGSAAERGDQAVVAGFPLDGPYRLGAARVRQVVDARGPNIYDDKQVTRAIYSLYAIIRPGNSGGPMVGTDGRVEGVVFAKSVDDDSTGYALTLEEVRPVLQAASHASGPVRTGQCAA